MALPNKGWKKIVVSDNAYAWSIKHASPWLHVQVLLPDGSGRRLSAEFDEDRVVTPRVVCLLIETALENGWTPSESGPAIKVDGDKLVAGTDCELNHPPDCNWTH